MKTLRHIVLAVRALPHHGLGGMEAVAWDVATALADRGIGVTVLTAEIPGRSASFVDRGVRVRALPGTNCRRYGRRWWSTTRRVFEQEMLEDCDLVLSISAGGFGLLPLRTRIPDVPFVLQAHGTSMGEVLSKWRSGNLFAMATSARNLAYIPKDLRAYGSFDAIVAVGQRVFSDFSTWPYRRAAQSGRIKLIRNGIDTAVFRPDTDQRQRFRTELGCGTDTRLIISASRLHKQKGIALGLDAFALLTRTRSDLRYLILGDGPERTALQTRTSALGISERVHFLGGIPRERMPRYLNAADVMLFTTTHVEGEPLNVLEALAVGLPVVASRHLYPRATPSDKVIPVYPDDRGEVCAGLGRALHLAHDTRQCSLPPGCSMADTTQSYLELFNSLLNERPRDRKR